LACYDFTEWTYHEYLAPWPLHSNLQRA
jgi:hypothetical protein